MKNLMKLSLMLAISLLSTNCTTTSHAAHINGWVQIGEKTVNLNGDRGVMYVRDWRDEFTRLKFKVIKAPVYIRNIRIVYGNGNSHNVNVNRRFGAGQESRVIDLPGGHRDVERIVFNYDTVNVGKGRAVLMVFGRL